MKPMLVILCIVSVVALVGSAIVAVFVILGKMFEYVLYSLCGKDLPMWADIICGVIGNASLLLAWFICLILRIFGIDAPFFP